MRAALDCTIPRPLLGAERKHNVPLRTTHNARVAGGDINHPACNYRPCATEGATVGDHAVHGLEILIGIKGPDHIAGGINSAQNTVPSASEDNARIELAGPACPLAGGEVERFQPPPCCRDSKHDVRRLCRPRRRDRMRAEPAPRIAEYATEFAFRIGIGDRERWRRRPSRPREGCRCRLRSAG
jgi:hypothetical protein